MPGKRTYHPKKLGAKERTLPGIDAANIDVDHPSQPKNKQYKNSGQMNNKWVFQGVDGTYNKTSYQLAYSERLPDVMAKVKRVCAAKMRKKIKHMITTPTVGAVNYVGYENTVQPKEYRIPRSFTDGLKPETFGKAFFPTPTQSKLNLKPPVRPLRPPSGSLAGSAVRREKVLYEATIANYRHCVSARSTTRHHLSSKVSMGSDEPTKITNYRECHNGRQRERPITAPSKPYKTSV